MNIINHSPMTAATCFLMNQDGAEVLLLVLKGTWRIEDSGTLTVADEQAPVNEEAVYHGEPGESSLIYETDVVLEKPGTDCVLIGCARALKTRMPFVTVTFGVGPVVKKAKVFGERHWEKGFLGERSIVKVRPVDEVPLIWENAFGGTDLSWKDSARHNFCAENPVGRGFMAKKTTLNFDHTLLPNIEDATRLISYPGQRVKPAGFGMIAPYWQPSRTVNRKLTSCDNPILTTPEKS